MCYLGNNLELFLSCYLKTLYLVCISDTKYRMHDCDLSLMSYNKDIF